MFLHKECLLKELRNDGTISI